MPTIMPSDDPKCDKCGLEITTGAMAAFCPQAFDCEFWPHSKTREDEGGELLISKMWIDNALKQIGLQIEDRKKLARDLDMARTALEAIRELIDGRADTVDGEGACDPPSANIFMQIDMLIDAVLPV